MIHITIDGQQFEIGPDSMQVENEEVFELVKNSARVFKPYLDVNLGPYALKILPYDDPYALKILSYDGSIKNFAFYLKDNAQWPTVNYDHVLYRRKMYTLKHPKFQTQFELPLSYSSGLVEVIHGDNWFILDVAIVNGSYLSRPNITVYAKMIGNEEAYDCTGTPPSDRCYELYIECIDIIEHPQNYEWLCDDLTKLSALPI